MNNTEIGLFKQSPKMVTESGEINPAAYANPEDRIAAFQKLFPPEKYNIVLFTNFAMGHLPKGVTLHPQFIECKDDDYWDQSDLGDGVKLPPGHVMLTAEFMIRIGLAAGIELQRTFEGQVEVDGAPCWRILYSAKIRLPDGTMMVGPETGKTQALKNGAGKTQAHIIENTDKKARRNAIKELLTIPTIISLAEAKRRWVVVKTIYEPGSEAEKLIQQKASSAARLLYDPSVNRVQSYIERFTDATTMEELERWYVESRESDLPEIEKRGLHTYYAEHRNRLKGANL